MTQINIKPLHPNQLTTLFDLVVSQTQPAVFAAIGIVPTYPEFLKQTVDDPDLDPGLLLGAFHGSKLIGAAMGVYRKWRNYDKAHVKWIFVIPQYRRRGVGKQLLNKIESELKRNGACEIAFGSSSPIYWFAGIPNDDLGTQRFLDTVGWDCTGERVSIYAHLENECHWNEQFQQYLAQTQNVHLKIASQAELPKAYQFITDQFYESWAMEGEQNLKDPAADAFCSLLINSSTLEIIGFSVVGGTNPKWFGPMGVKKEYRNKGLGRLLVLHSLGHYRSKGFDQLMIPWINGKEDFYGPLIKNKKWYRLMAYAKKIT